MPEALWVQAGSVSYAADEDRKLISALSTPGVSKGLALSIGSGLQVNVAAGVAIIDDGAGGAFVGYTTGTSTVTLPASTATNNIYLVVDPATALTTVVAGATPSNPALQLGSAVTGATTVTSVTNSTVRAQPPSLADAVVRKAGDTMTGALTVPSLATTGEVNAAGGLKLGSAAQPTRRHYAIVSTSNSSTSVPVGAWTRVNFTGAVDGGTSDYGVTPHVGNGRFQAAVNGFYLFSGYINWPVGTADTERAGLIARFPKTNTSGTFAAANQGYVMTNPLIPQRSGVNTNSVFHCLFYLSADQYACACVYHNSAAALALAGGYMTFSLFQAT
jgi:hypothetical protein